ncbi:MAG: hypothetical protein WD058_08150 [Dehalococcoidia bacterium]
MTQDDDARDDEDAPEDDGWAESQEGDLDPDLAIEGAYGDWEPGAGRAVWPLAVRVVGVMLIVALVGAVVLPALF